MSDSGSLYRLSSFSETVEGGNPAGVWVGNTLPAAQEMQKIAAEVGYSETAFVVPNSGKERTVKYFSPEAEVSFCGHATVATGALLGELEGEGEYIFRTPVGNVPVTVVREKALFSAALTSVEPKQRSVPEADLHQALSLLGWEQNDLDSSIPPMLAFGGAWHLVIAASSIERLNSLDYDFDGLKALMLERELTTVQLVYRESDALFHSRNPFPVGGVIEDPATGAAAAALGGYLRDAQLIEVPKDILIRQGEAMGRPSQLHVHVPEEGGIVVRGTAVRI